MIGCKPVTHVLDSVTIGDGPSKVQRVIKMHA